MLFFVLVCVALIRATYVTEANLRKCINQGGKVGLQCNGGTPEDPEPMKKLVVGVAVTHGINAEMDVLVLSSITEEGEDEKLPLVDGFKITIEKTAPILHYPLIHYHTVSYFPYEEVIPVKNTAVGVQACIDADEAPNPHCGWTYSVPNDPIDHSQGFCCNKDLELVTDTSGKWRGEAFLGRESSALDSFSTAHCLRMGELIYHGYEVETYKKFFELKIKLIQGVNELAFTLSPAEPIYNTDYSGDAGAEYFNVRAELVGDFAAYSQAPLLNNHILYIPTSPDTHAYVQEYESNMLLVPREEVSKDGSECDKVGVSFYQFQKQSAVCSTSLVGDCLHNQLYHKHNADLLKLGTGNTGAVADYLVHGLKVFKGSMDFQPGMKKILEYKVTDIQNSLLYFEIDAAILQVVESEVTGILVNAHVEKFTSMSNEGTMTMTVENPSRSVGYYVATVSDCTVEILDAIPAKALTIQAEQTEKISFNIYTKENLQTSHSCWARLRAPTGKLFDEIEVVFNTEMHNSKYSWDLQQKNEGTQQSDSKSFGLGQCECKFFDLPCKFIKMCWVDIIIMVVIVLGIVAAVVAVIVFFLAGGGNYVPAILCYFCKTFGCCLKLVGCFTKFFVKETVKAGKFAVREGVRGANHVAREKRRKKRKKKRKGKKKKKQKKGKKKKKYQVDDDDKEILQPLASSQTLGMNKDQIDSYCETGDVCYMNVNCETELGAEMLNVMKDAMPLDVDGEFCLVGTIRFKRGTYQFIIHEELLNMTWYHDGDKFVACESEEGTKRIPDQYRGYSLQLDHLNSFVSTKPFDGHVVINQPLGM